MTIRFFILLSALQICGSLPAAADPESAPCGAKISKPLSLMPWESMDFGIVAPNASAAGEVAVDAEGDAACLGGATCLQGEIRPARFKVMGEPDRAYSLQAPTSIELRSAAGGVMIIDNVRLSQSGGVLTNGQDEFQIGGTLNVPANQAGGVYAGAYIVTAYYQ